MLPPMLWSEHPGPSSPAQGAEFAARVLGALTDNPGTWSRTVMFQVFDENDGMFDHMPPPAPPSFHADGTVAGGATLKLEGEYFSDPERKHLHPEDVISGTVRPWGLGPRVPMYVISPWSRGGWINSQVFDHTSVGQFLEKRFGVTIPAISPWHRAVCGDMTSAFDFVSPNDPNVPALPDTRGSATLVAMAMKLPRPVPPNEPEGLFQEQGARPSRALPYVFVVDATVTGHGVGLTFRSLGAAGGVLHVYDKRHPDRIPRRYTVEAGKGLTDRWDFAADGGYDLWAIGPNGFLREFKGTGAQAGIEVSLRDVPQARAVKLTFNNEQVARRTASLSSSVYEPKRSRNLVLKPGSTFLIMEVAKSGDWYDLRVDAPGFARRFAGRVETGRNSVSDPVMGIG